MLDMKWIRQNKNEVQKIADWKGITLSLDHLLAVDERKKNLQQDAEQLRQERNTRSKAIGHLVASGDAEGAQQIKLHVREINEKLAMLDRELAKAQQELEQLILLVPNVVSPDTPYGRSDADNVLLRQIGQPREADFPMQDHVELGKLHDLMDIPRGVKTAGSRNYYLKGAGVLLHRAVQQLALDLLVSKSYTLLEVPLMVRTDAMYHSAYFPLGQDQTYRLADSDNWLAGTSEVPLIAYYSNEIIDLREPVKLAAASTCFRSEVGSTGKDVHGLYRVHQFAKVEQVVLCEADQALSDQLLHEITANAEELLQLLELPYQVMAVCTGDMSQKTYKQFDIETWMPSRPAYGETHSSSSLHDFQARRSNIRYRDESGKLRYCYTLNNTAVASPRILIPLLENHQQEDGSIRIPKALQPYMDGREFLVSAAADE
ncbi:serine--tRNA ligase [Paenibacillus sp. FJAT-26967]|uniref:serine--tRNA ligase n=1 Tax=Paenibacillus sp. FJAT-26967 TaxID=1729690 RepID=UPI000839A4A1|nr:serine--tRNA ligase [Paenibacillus sp. FJAT-26967]